jgi:succinate dehydrogenase/fumarate reductase cytochrome b subunit
MTSNSVTDDPLFKHAIYMLISFGFILPFAIIGARYFKVLFLFMQSQLNSWWLRIHIVMVTSAAVLIIVGLYNTRLIKSGKGYLLNNFHSISGFFLLSVTIFQNLLGAKCTTVDPNMKRESYFERLHGILGKTILFIGFISIVSGTMSLPAECESIQFFIIQLSACFIVFAVIGFSILEYTRGRKSRHCSISISDGSFVNQRNQPPEKETRLFAHSEFEDSPVGYRPRWKSIPKQVNTVDHYLAESASNSKKTLPLKGKMDQVSILMPSICQSISTPKSRTGSVSRTSELSSLKSSRESVTLLKSAVNRFGFVNAKSSNSQPVGEFTRQ